jgi:nitrite reductase (NADH) large subunit
MKIVIVGHGMVGHKLVEELVAKGQPSDQIIILGEEPRAAYDRVHLSAYFSGTTADELSLVADGFFETHAHAVLNLNAKVSSIDRAARTVTLAGGECISYDKLVLATGSFPFVPPIPGSDRPACLVYRTIEDLESITLHGRQSKVGVVVGGGLLGLEAARALKDLGLATHVVEFAPRLMAVQIDDGGARVLRRKIEALGVTVHLNKSTTEIRAGENTLNRLVFSDGSSLQTDLVVFSAGIRPRDELARACGLEIGARGGIAIDDDCRTSDPDIFAVGECAAHSGRIYGLVGPGYQMAEVVARRICGLGGVGFGGADMSTKLKLLGVDVASFGDAHAQSPGALAYSYVDERKEIYKKLVVNESGSEILGGILVGEAEDYGSLLQMMLNRIAPGDQPESLILPAPDGAAKPGMGIGALPDTAQICSCNNVSKGNICQAIVEGAVTIGALKTCTKAATSCGGCASLVTQILKFELARSGVAVNNHLCEHFAYSRQELYHLVRVEKLKSFETLVAQHGKGRGCDICKPAVASILASCWNEPVVSARHVKLQDTNDYYLANIQKDGTYSIVPRVPGGEITPAGLIAIGEVAKKYGLYTKITGGQRIDLFGAQVHQLPPIWEELIAAGFESGHAYGKALRTVKSCVGSTWCRYGVQDSTSLAIELEMRYRGVRSPHKIKFGVSGCTRECAEAQGKDVGVIATERGWNLYVCGNGGMKPRHADLLANDLDHDTLIKTIDRFLMFYIRTADRLQRTAGWLENLEGGLDYLKSVICDDRLSIVAELDAEMQHLVDTYQCEWKLAVEDPEMRRRFRTFVNSESADANVVFVQERGQIRPATTAERVVSRNSMQTELAKEPA